MECSYFPYASRAEHQNWSIHFSMSTENQLTARRCSSPSCTDAKGLARWDMLPHRAPFNNHHCLKQALNWRMKRTRIGTCQCFLRRKEYDVFCSRRFCYFLYAIAAVNSHQEGATQMTMSTQIRGSVKAWSIFF